MIPVFKLGLSIKPEDIRLITHADDPYIWQALPEKQHLFKKQLSKHSIGAYRELCREVGVSFEAVPTIQPDAHARSKSDKESPENPLMIQRRLTRVIDRERLPTKLHNEDSTIGIGKVAIGC